MTDPRLLALIEDLRQRPEAATVEFKVNNTNPEVIGRLISALSNAARIENREFGYIVWGIRDGDRTVVGTRFEPDSETRQRQPYEFWLAQRLNPSVALSFKEVDIADEHVVLLEIPAATTVPIEFEGTARIRIGSATPPLSEYPDRQQALWANLRPYAWEGGVARQFVPAGEVTELLDVGSYFDRVGRPSPASGDRVLEELARDRLIAPDVGGRWKILNLGAILFAKDLGEFEFGLDRKAVRFVAYDGDGRASTVTHRWDFRKGYAVCIDAVNDHVITLVPSPEDNGAVVRQGAPLFPSVAVRELIANALIHQDMTITGAGPMVELFRNRLEITNPGAPLVDADRFLDAPPRSRNEALAALMRRMGLCERPIAGPVPRIRSVPAPPPAQGHTDLPWNKRHGRKLPLAFVPREEGGTGIDKVVEAVEMAQRPPPDFRAEANATRVTLFGPRRFSEMTTDERLRACYLHAGLTYLQGGRMRNSSLRARLGVSERNASQVSQVIRQALNRELIRPADPDRPRSGYVPFWA